MMNFSVNEVEFALNKLGMFSSFFYFFSSLLEPFLPRGVGILCCICRNTLERIDFYSELLSIRIED